MVFLNFKEPRNRFQGIDSVSLYSLAGLYHNSIPTRFLSLIDGSKIPALAGRYDNTIPTRFLASIECFKIPAQFHAFGSRMCRDGIFKLLRRPEIDSIKLILSVYAAWRAGTTTLLLLGS